MSPEWEVFEGKPFIFFLLHGEDLGLCLSRAGTLKYLITMRTTITNTMSTY